MSQDSNIPDLASAGLISAPAAEKESESQDLAEEILGGINQTLERLMSSMTAQHLLIQSQDVRISHLEKLLTALALKDPVIGPTILKMAKALNMELDSGYVAPEIATEANGAAGEQPNQ